MVVVVVGGGRRVVDGDATAAFGRAVVATAGLGWDCVRRAGVVTSSGSATVVDVGSVVVVGGSLVVVGATVVLVAPLSSLRGSSPVPRDRLTASAAPAVTATSTT